MCCFFTVLVFIGPRAAILVWWLISPNRWEAAFDSFIWPFLGFIFAPWTTLMWVSVASGGITGFDYVIVGLGIFIDIASYSSSAWYNRERYVAA
jgi:succinate dehydrogenase/fumarate reductase cytochrome b subunit